jgi:hypothetical protein
VEELAAFVSRLTDDVDVKDRDMYIRMLKEDIIPECDMGKKLLHAQGWGQVVTCCHDTCGKSTFIGGAGDKLWQAVRGGGRLLLLCSRCDTVTCLNCSTCVDREAAIAESAVCAASALLPNIRVLFSASRCHPPCVPIYLCKRQYVPTAALLMHMDGNFWFFPPGISVTLHFPVSRRVVFEAEERLALRRFLQLFVRAFVTGGMVGSKCWLSDEYRAVLCSGDGDMDDFDVFLRACDCIQAACLPATPGKYHYLYNLQMWMDKLFSEKEPCTSSPTLHLLLEQFFVFTSTNHCPKCYRPIENDERHCSMLSCCDVNWCGFCERMYKRGTVRCSDQRCPPFPDYINCEYDPAHVPTLNRAQAYELMRIARQAASLLCVVAARAIRGEQTHCPASGLEAMLAFRGQSMWNDWWCKYGEVPFMLTEALHDWWSSVIKDDPSDNARLKRLLT